MRRGDRPGLPYHRVIAAGGALGGYSSLPLKRSLLAAEGLTVTPRRVVGFAKIRWPASARKRATAGPPKRPAEWAEKANKYEPFRQLTRLS